MKVLLQRVNRAEVKVEGKSIGSIGKGLLLLVGFGKGDAAEKLNPMAEKICNLRIFPNEKAKFDLSVREVVGELLLVPQFTLYGETSKGRRPEFFAALEPLEASKLFDEFVACCRQQKITKVATGEFGAYMQVSLENDGPVTLLLEA